MQDVFRYADELGPVKIIHVYEPAAFLKAVLVVDNIARGPALGGIRMAEDVSTEECFRLARAMTFKNAAAGLPHGGGKIVVYGNPKMAKDRKEKMLRALASLLRNEEDYIFAPDMGTDEECMAWIRDEVGRVVGLPRELGGIPLDEIGATGWGLSHITDVALEFCNFAIADAKVVIQGFGAVGRNAALFLRDRGALLVATADTGGAVYNPDGLNVDALIQLKNEGKSVAEYSGGSSMPADGLIDVACDIWIPAARPDVIHDDNVGRLNTKLVVEGANIPITRSAEESLHRRNILCIPDFIANAGGVICAAMEYKGSNKTAVFQAIEEKLRRNVQLVLERMKNEGVLPRQAAEEMATERVKKAMGFRRFALFSTAPGFI